MASTDHDKFTFTYQQVTAWREQLFDNRSLRITVEELTKWLSDAIYGPPFFRLPT